MKPVYFAVLGLFLALPALAQEADIPLFDDGDRPNLGRHAKPLDQITLTPPELPTVKVSLSERKHPPVLPHRSRILYRRTLLRILHRPAASWFLRRWI